MDEICLYACSFQYLFVSILRRVQGAICTGAARDGQPSSGGEPINGRKTRWHASQGRWLSSTAIACCDLPNLHPQAVVQELAFRIGGPTRIVWRRRYLAFDTSVGMSTSAAAGGGNCGGCGDAGCTCPVAPSTAASSRRRSPSSGMPLGQARCARHASAVSLASARRPGVPRCRASRERCCR